MRSVRSRRVALIIIVALVFTIFTINRVYVNKPSISEILPSIVINPGHPPSTAIVVAALEKDVVDWVELREGWEVWKYEVDNPNAQHKVLENKGNEANVFLTHLIDQYDNLTDRVVFMHSQRYQWHNDHPKYDAKANLQQLRLEHIDEEGYVNLRCHWFQGCPAELSFPNTPPNPPDTSPTLLNYYSYSFPTIFPGQTLPNIVAAGCCSQFAVSSAAIRRNSKSDYVRIRKWLLETQIPNYMSGRVMEYSWHILFGKSAVHCPSAEMCYCKTYGQCGLTCTEGDCGQYQYPLNISWFKTVYWKLKHAFD